MSKPAHDGAPADARRRAKPWRKALSQRLRRKALPAQALAKSLAARSIWHYLIAVAIHAARRSRVAAFEVVGMADTSREHTEMQRLPA
jgi:hypothetical protein